MVRFADLSKGKRATLYSVRAIQVHEGEDPKAVEVIDEVQSMPYVATSASTVHAALSELVANGVLVRVEDPDDGRGSRYQFADEEIPRVLEDVVEARGSQLGLTIAGGDE